MFNTFLWTLTVLISAICIILVGGIIPLIERKFLSLVQRRVGPKIVGLKGRLQFIADAVKVLVKEYLYIQLKSTIMFTILPITSLVINVLLIFFLGFSNYTVLAETRFNILILLITETLFHAIVLTVGFKLFNKYTKLASNRLLNVLLVTEVLNLLVLLIIIFLSNDLFLQKLSALSQSILNLNILILFPVLLIFILLNTQRAPFDIIEAETEIIMGHHSEYSGFWFGLFVLIEYLHLFVFALLYSFLLLMFNKEPTFLLNHITSNKQPLITEHWFSHLTRFNYVAVITTDYFQKI